MSNNLSFVGGYRSRTNCNYQDCCVDGHRLAGLLKVGDFIPPFGWLKPELEQHFSAMLLRKQESDLRPGRVPLFVCPECVDYGCGVVTCCVRRQGDEIVWCDFGFEYDYDVKSNRIEGLPFRFDARQYYQAFFRLATGGH